MTEHYRETLWKQVKDSMDTLNSMEDPPNGGAAILEALHALLFFVISLEKDAVIQQREISLLKGLYDDQVVVGKFHRKEIDELKQQVTRLAVTSMPAEDGRRLEDRIKTLEHAHDNLNETSYKAEEHLQGRHDELRRYVEQQGHRISVLERGR